MSPLASSPLAALVSYYDRLQSDPSQAVPDFGFSRQKISFQVVIEKDGSLHGIEDARVDADGRQVPKLMTVPGQSKPSGQGINPCFLWDSARYVLGFKTEDDDPQRTADCFNAFRVLHLSIESRVNDHAFSAVCRFLEDWEPSRSAQYPQLAESGTGFGVFRLRAHEEFVHQRLSVIEFWTQQVAAEQSENEAVGASLLTGEVEPLARIHEPKIKGVADAQSSGAVIVGFNEPAYESYGKTQSYNAPVGVRDAFRYATALNQLLADNTRRVRIGDATVVFWAEHANAKDAEDIFAAFFGERTVEGEGSESGRMVDRVGSFLQAARQGRLADLVSDPDGPFYILGLAPNASRINVRFWLAGTVAQFAERLARHAADLETAGARPGDPPLVIRRMLLETAREPKDIPPRLAGEVARAVLAGLPYPHALFSAVVRRVRIDATMNHCRASVLKAYLVRNRNEEVPVALNKDYPDEAYHLGRLFAALEKTQEDASGRSLNSTIKDRYFGAASATPASVFPQLLRLHQHHIEKIENPGLRVNREKLVGEICGHINRFPPHLPLAKQGLFHIAYYHQRQDFFTKKDAPVKETSDE